MIQGDLCVILFSPATYSSSTPHDTKSQHLATDSHSVPGMCMYSVYNLLIQNYCGTTLRQTPLGPKKLSIIERVSSGQGFIMHYVGYIWDSVCVHYRDEGVSSKRGSTVGLHGLSLASSV